MFGLQIWLIAMVNLWRNIQATLSLLPLAQCAPYSNDSSSELAYSPHHYPTPQGGRIIDQQWDEAYNRAREFVGKLSLAEKVNLTTGTGGLGRCVGNTGDVASQDMWGLCLEDGPLGVRPADLVTGFPPGIAAGATFNRDLINARGHAIGYEFAHKGVDIALGPVVGPLGLKALGGRGFEAFGADQYLQGVASAETVIGMQDEGVMANAKHWIGNEQEVNRTTISSNMDDRTLHEVYAYPFANMIQAGVGSVMCSYNLLNNSWSCENSYTLNKVLKDELGFQGTVISDWGATHSMVNAITSGQDMDMPGSDMWGANITTAVLNGTLPIDRLDDMVTRTMAAYFKVGLDKSRKTRGPPNFSQLTTADKAQEFASVGYGEVITVNEHVDVRKQSSYDVAYDTAVESVVLLKNNGVLPLSNNTKRIAVLGAAARDNSYGSTCTNVGCRYNLGEVDGATQLGWGSGATYYPYFISPYDGVRQRASQDWISVDSYFDVNSTTEAFNHTATGSEVNLIFGMADSGEGSDRDNATMHFDADETVLNAASQHPNNVVVISSVGVVDMEKWVEHENVTAVIIALPGGQDTGKAIADVLFGDVNPSGRLPFTIAKQESDYWPIIEAKPASNGHEQDDDIGKAGVFFDYRHFDHNDIEPRFEFGYGLSYSNFTFDSLNVQEVAKPPQDLPRPQKLRPATENKDELPSADSLVFPKDMDRVPTFVYPYLNDSSWADKHGEYKFPEGYSSKQPEDGSLAGGASGGNPALWQTAYRVTANMKNEGDTPGSFVAQMYVGFPQNEEFPSPPRQLRGFEKYYLAQGQSQPLQFDIMTRDLSVWDVKTASWIVQRGEYKIYVGSSSRNLQLQDTITI